MKAGTFLIITLFSFGWILLGIQVVNYLFPGYSCGPMNNYHIWFFLSWATSPVIGILLYGIRKANEKEETPNGD